MFHYIKSKIIIFLDTLQINRRERLSIGFFILILIIIQSMIALDTRILKPVKQNEDINTTFKLLHEKWLDERRKVDEDKFTVAKNTDTTKHKSQNLKSDNAKININTASATLLETLPNIGKKTALNIILYREQHGGFKHIEELKNIKGIGQAKFNKILPYINVIDITDISTIEQKNRTTSVKNESNFQIDVNNATIEDWEKIPRIGKVLAKRIVDYRQQINGFTHIDDLIQVKGIGKKMLEKMKPYLKITKN